MAILLLILIFILGLIIGSFLSALTYRLPKGKSVFYGRSFCPHCKKKIVWFDNIPLLSYILLKGRCRRCHKRISWRYPAIEFATGLSFVAIFTLLNNCTTTFRGLPFKGGALCSLSEHLGFFSLPFFLLVVSALIVIFVIDIENQIIPDRLIFFLFLITFFLLLFSSSPTLFTHLLSGFTAASFMLLIHLATHGRGMGLGDVKFALFAGTLLSWPQTVVWLYTSFVIGAIIGVILVALRKAKFGKQIPFGPFLIISLFISLIWGNPFTDWLVFMMR